jgi:hypothetical protein
VAAFLAGITGANPAGSMDVSLLYVVRRQVEGSTQGGGGNPRTCDSCSAIDS